MEAQDDPTWTLHLQRCQQNVAAVDVDQPPPFSALHGIVTSLLTAVCALPHLSAAQRPCPHPPLAR